MKEKLDDKESMKLLLLQNFLAMYSTAILGVMHGSMEIYIHEICTCSLKAIIAEMCMSSCQFRMVKGSETVFFKFKKDL